jgi:hypothetical protein
MKSRIANATAVPNVWAAGRVLICRIPARQDGWARKTAAKKSPKTWQYLSSVEILCRVNLPRAISSHSIQPPAGRC